MTTDQLAERRFQKMVDSIMERLSTDRAVIESVDVLTSFGMSEAVETWRGAGRAAARQLNLPVRTGISRDGRVWIEVFPLTSKNSVAPLDRDELNWITELLPPDSKRQAVPSDASV